MKRHTRSSRHSPEDASRGSGERSTRTRKSSDDLFVTELPKPARSRKPSVEEPDSRKDAAKRRHPSGSKHRTRSHSGSSNHLQEVSPAKVPRRESGSRGSTSKSTDKNCPEGGGRVEIPKRHDTRNKRSPQELAQTPESKKHAAKVGNSHSTRTRNNSGKKNSREDHGQTGIMLPNEVISVAKKPPAVDSLSQPSGASIPHSVKRSSDVTKAKISHKPPTLTNSHGGKGVLDSYKISHNPQRASVQGIKKVVDKDKTAMPAGVKENASKSNTNQIRTESSEAKKTSPDTSMRTELRVNHSEVSSHIPEEIVGEGLIDGTQNRRRNKSSSRNLAPEFNSSVKKQLDERPRVVTNSGNDSTTGEVARMKELSSGPKTCPDAIMPTELSGKKGGDSKVSDDRSASGISNSDASRSDVITVPTSGNTDQMPPSVQPSSAKNSLLNKPKQSPMNNKDKESLSGIHEETHSSSKSTSNTPKDNLQKLDTHQKVKAKAQLGLGVCASAKSSSISKSSDLASTSAPPISAGGDNNDSGGRVTPLNKEVDPTAGGDEEQDVGFEASDWSRDVAESEPFFFESDHLALKGNKDYRMLLRTLTTLEAQRKQATQDLERLVKEQRQALSEPINFVNKIQHKVDLKLPLPQRVVSLPEVTWETYLGKPENSELLQTMASQKVKTRPSNSASGSSHHNCLCCKKNGPCSKSEQHSASSSGTSSAKTKPTSTDPKSETFNQAWTSDEQRRLEELLVKYPMEAVEARRWEKIAKALGHRTPLQVASRVQKYFIKLTRAGLPVPGRLPHTTQLIGKRGRGGRFGFMRPHIPSTFLQSWVPPVFMNDNDSWDSFDSYQDDEEELSDDDTIPTELRDSEEYKELKKLRQLKNEKIRQQAQMTHLGFQCDRCGVEPIVGTRWHCSDCPSSTSTDLCQKCMDKDDYQSIMHTSSHHLEPIRFKMEATYVDGDYVRFQQQLGSYNYLDTNYAPLHKPEYNS